MDIKKLSEDFDSTSDVIIDLIDHVSWVYNFNSDFIKERLEELKSIKNKIITQK